MDISSCIVSIKKLPSQKKQLCVAMLGIATLGFLQIFFLSAPSNFQQNMLVEIPDGSTLSETATILKDNNIIQSPFWFKVGGTVLYQEEVKAGDYVFKTPLSLFSVLSRVARGTFDLSLSKVTIPEGYTKLQIAGLLAPKFPLFDKEYFLTYAPEGYLFPDTYFFFQDVKAKAVSGRMQDIFNTKTTLLKEDAKNQGKSFANIVVVASILEEEVKTPADKKLVAGIIYKRLSINMPLQVDSASATYSQKGLPLSPISNPGLESLDAALNPTKSDYLYYLSDKAGKIYYAKTFEEHQTNRENHLGK